MVLFGNFWVIIFDIRVMMRDPMLGVKVVSVRE